VGIHGHYDFTISDQIRRYVFETYVVPTRKQQSEKVTVRVGDVAKALHQKMRMPLVCDVIGGEKFQQQFGITLLERTGPKRGPNTCFTFRV
jgi:5-methylcytosine-specific restriction enzyme B